MAFLLGYFDGDGKQGTSLITSGSLKFLLQIKKKFNIENDIQRYRKKKRDKIHEWNNLYLGTIFFNEMLDNYKDSLPRKRIRLITKEEKIERIKQAAWRRAPEKKLKISKEQLKNIIWKIPTKIIAEKYNVSAKTIEYWCKKWNIKKPPRGYWAKRHGK